MDQKLIHTNIEDYIDFLKDESRTQGKAQSISFPGTSDQAVEIVDYIRNEQRSITIQGARTGIAGGAVPGGGHILNMSRMNKILSLSELEEPGGFVLKVQPGLILSDLQTHLIKGTIDTTGWDEQAKNALLSMNQQGHFFFPPDPTETSASIGGMIACNASGACSLLYGPTRRYIHSLTLLCADGSKISLCRGREKATGRDFAITTDRGNIITGSLPSYTMPGVKNASGYYVRDNMDLIDLVIGSEGTLGILLDVELLLVPKPAYTWGITCFLPGEEHALAFVRHCRRAYASMDNTGLPVKPAAMEFFDSRALALLTKMKSSYAAFSTLPRIPDNSGSAVYIELHADDPELLDTTVLTLSGLIAEHSGDENATWFATEPRELDQLLHFRHAIPEAVNLYIDMKKKQGLSITKLGTDMAVRDDQLDNMYNLYHSSLAKAGLDYVMFGHIGNNHIHVNILPSSEEEYKTGKKIYKEWAREITGLNGTVSAEHGIGKLKTEFLSIMYGEKGIGEMIKIKQAFDPGMLLNPGNLFPYTSG